MFVVKSVEERTWAFPNKASGADKIGCSLVDKLGGVVAWDENPLKT
jgi:hypothetical protein